MSKLLFALKLWLADCYDITRRSQVHTEPCTCGWPSYSHKEPPLHGWQYIKDGCYPLREMID